MWEPEDWDSPICHSKWSSSVCVDPHPSSGEPARKQSEGKRGGMLWMDGWMDGWRPHMDTRHSPYKGMAVCGDSRGLTHERTSPQHHARSTDAHRQHTSRVPSGPLRRTHTCQNTMWTAQTERWWEQTLHHHTRFARYTSSFSLSLHFNFFYPRTLSLLPFSSFLPSPLLCFLNQRHITGFSLFFQPASQTHRCHQAANTFTQWHFDLINSISQEVHLQNKPADIVPDLKNSR